MLFRSTTWHENVETLLSALFFVHAFAIFMAGVVTAPAHISSAPRSLHPSPPHPRPRAIQTRSGRTYAHLRQNHRLLSSPLIIVREIVGSLRKCLSSASIDPHGSAWDPVILPVFKTGAWHLRGVMGVFDSHTLPPSFNPIVAAHMKRTMRLQRLGLLYRRPAIEGYPETPLT
jgi:hypothetical protein